jgi:hypothetical protein
VNYSRSIRPNWGEPGKPAFNLKMELADIRSREDLINATMQFGGKMNMGNLGQEDTTRMVAPLRSR